MWCTIVGITMSGEGAGGRSSGKEGGARSRHSRWRDGDGRRPSATAAGPWAECRTSRPGPGIGGPEGLTVTACPSDGDGIAEGTWETSAPNKKGQGGTALGSYGASVANVTA